MFKFIYPLYLLITVPALLLLIYRLKNKAKSGVLYSGTSLLKLAAKKNHLSTLPHFLRFLGLFFLIISLAGPVRESVLENNEASGIDIILAIDVSGSMAGLDFSTKTKKQTRLDAVKLVAKEFVESRPNDRIGVVAFGGAPYVASPLTLDHDWLFQRMEMLETGMIDGGTAIGSAISSASSALNRVDSKSKIIILLTDGENTSGLVQPEQAAEAAGALGIKIYTVGAGKDGQAPYETNSFFGKEIKYIDVNIDEEMLTEVADLTGGRYFRAKDISSLESIYDEINKLEKTTRINQKTINHKHYFIFTLSIGLFFIVLEFLLSLTVIRRII